MSLGDTVSQKVIEKKQEFDVARNARFAALGLFFVVSIFSVFVSAKGKNFCKGSRPSICKKEVLYPEIGRKLLLSLMTVWFLCLESHTFTWTLYVSFVLMIPSSSRNESLMMSVPLIVFDCRLQSFTIGSVSWIEKL